MAMPLTWSAQNKSPSDKKDEHVLTFENVSITLKKDNLKFSVGETSIKIAKDKIVSTSKAIKDVGKSYLG
jgi:hypothetical protein